jgi:hypothetical protein
MSRHLLDAEEESMERKTVDELKHIAEIHCPQMSKQQRLMRWADLLERQANRILVSLIEVEYVPPQERAEMQVDNSALSVAFEDPVLRAEGLKSDKFGDAVNFFELSEEEVHQVVCYCHRGPQIDARTVAGAVRYLAARTGRASAWGWIGDHIGVRLPSQAHSHR